MKTKLLKRVRKNYYFELAYLNEFNKTTQILRLMSNDSEYSIEIAEVKNGNIYSAKKELLEYLIGSLRRKYPELGNYNKKYKPKFLPFNF